MIKTEVHLEVIDPSSKPGRTPPVTTRTLGRVRALVEHYNGLIPVDNAAPVRVSLEHLADYPDDTLVIFYVKTTDPSRGGEKDPNGGKGPRLPEPDEWG